MSTVAPENARTAHGNVEVERTAPTTGASDSVRAAFAENVAACIREHGIVVLHEAIPRHVIDAIYADFKSTYDTYMRPGQEKLFRNFQDDPKRAQIPVSPVGAMADPMLFANPAVMSVLRLLLGNRFIIGEMGGVISHPGSEPQYTHRDSDFLFGGLPMETDLPPYSLTITVPLVDVPFERGPTEYWPGSHRRTDSKAITNLAPQCTELRAGSLLFYDGRLIHRGGPNRSDAVRPILYVTYQYPWYLERPGYDHKPQVRVTKRMLDRMAPEHRRLFEWALHLNRSDSFDEFVIRWAGRAKTHLIDPLRRLAPKK